MLAPLLQDGEYVSSEGARRLHLTGGDDEPLQGKAVYFLRMGEEALDIDKVRRRCACLRHCLPRGLSLCCCCQIAAAAPPPPTTRPAHLQAGDSRLLSGEIQGDVLGSLGAQLTDLYSRHVAERGEWSGVDGSFRAELEAELARTSASLADMRRGLSSGLSLEPLAPSVNLDELVKASLARAKAKKLRLEPAEVAALQGEAGGSSWRRARRCRRRRLRQRRRCCSSFCAHAYSARTPLPPDFGLSKSLPKADKHAGYDLDSKFKLTGETGSYR